LSFTLEEVEKEIRLRRLQSQKISNTTSTVKPDEEIRNLQNKITKELELLKSLDEKSKKIEIQKRDLKIKIQHQKERLIILKSILER
jgi:hypothetical protein